jgi:hypothetical protein
MLPDNGSEFAVCDAYDCDARKTVALAWRELIKRLPIRFESRRAKANPETRLAHMVVTVQRNLYAGGTDPTLIQRLEAELAATNDVQVRELFAKYLSEP